MEREYSLVKRQVEYPQCYRMMARPFLLIRAQYERVVASTIRNDEQKKSHQHTLMKTTLIFTSMAWNTMQPHPKIMAILTDNEMGTDMV